jgi:hypothetical protein
MDASADAHAVLRARAARRRSRRARLAMLSAVLCLGAGAVSVAAAELSGEQFTPQGSKLTTTPAHADDEAGHSVSLSADGDTALAGERHSGGAGVAYVFVRTGTSWAQQGPKLTAQGATQFGGSVALSGDGDTALVGGKTSKGLGAVWVFTFNGTTWAQQGAPLEGSGESKSSGFGASVAISGDGATALVGGPGNHGVGAVWVFALVGSTWTPQGPALVGNGVSHGGKFGSSVALSSDGNTALVGGVSKRSAGPAWVFVRTGTSWAQQGPKLPASGHSGSSQSYGDSVALSGDGNTALLGGPSNDKFSGAVWVFDRTATTWSAGGALTPSGEKGRGAFGASVALSGDGNTAVIGGPFDDFFGGAGWVFTRSAAGAWAQQGAKLTPAAASGASEFGSSAAISSDASTILIGGPTDHDLAGAVWVFAQPLPVGATGPS